MGAIAPPAILVPYGSSDVPADLEPDRRLATPAPRSIVSAALRCFVLIAMAMAAILIFLPAALGAAGTAVVIVP